jgi:hypothetical protein
VVAAAGNNAVEPTNLGGIANSPSYPAGLPGVIAVGSITPSGIPSTFSNYNPTTSVDLAAGGEMVAAWWRPASAGSLPYGVLQGTSFAAPLVSAAAAVMLRAAPGLSAEAVGLLLAETARDVAPPGPDARTGAGALDAAAALAAAQAAPKPGWLAVPHGGAFTVAPGAAFSIPFGVGGEPRPEVALAAPGVAGVRLDVDETGRPVLTGSISEPGRYNLVLAATQNGQMVGSATLTLSVSGDGAYRATWSTKSAITAAQAPTLSLTVTPLSGDPSGWFEVFDRASGARLAAGSWFPGTRTIHLGRLRPGSYLFDMALTRGGLRGDGEQVLTLRAQTPVVVSKAAAKVKVKAAGRKLTVTVSGPKALGAAKGKVVVKFKGKTKRVALKGGKAVIKKLPRGRYRIQAAYKGSAVLKAKTLKKKLRFG